MNCTVCSTQVTPELLYYTHQRNGPMLKGNLLKVIGETAQSSNLTRIEKFEVFCRVCDNMLAEGRISKVQHERWTNVF